MPRKLKAIGWPIAVAIAAVMLWPQTTGAQPVLFRVQTDTGNDTLWYGNTATIIFTIDPNGNQIAAFTFPLLIHFTNGNIIGPIREGFELIIPPEFRCFFCDPVITLGTDPDTLLWGWVNFGGYLDTAVEVARIVFTPLDRGQIHFDTTWLPPANVLSAVDPMAVSLPVEWESPPFTVVMPPCPVGLTGDDNLDGVVDALDVIHEVNYLFRGGPDPLPCIAASDLNGDGVVNAADLVYKVNYVFKSGPEPFDVCELIWNGVWTCE